MNVQSVLQKAYKEYITLLEKALNDCAGFMLAHGMQGSIEEAKKGEELRTLIDKLEKE